VAKKVEGESVQKAFRLYEQHRNYGDALRQICSQLKGVITSIKFRPNKMGLSESVTVSFSDGGAMRFTHLISEATTQTKITRVA